MKEKMKKIVLTVLILTLVFVPSTCSSAKGRTGLYVGGESNVRRVAISSIKKNKISFYVGYSGMKEGFSEKINVTLKKGKANFNYRDDTTGDSGNGCIKVLSKNKLKIKTSGSNIISTNGQWRTLKRVSSSTDIMAVY